MLQSHGQLKLSIFRAKNFAPWAIIFDLCHKSGVDDDQTKITTWSLCHAFFDGSSGSLIFCHFAHICKIEVCACPFYVKI